MPMPPLSFFPTTPTTKPKNQYADKALTSTTDAESDLLPGDRPRAVRLKPPIQGNEASPSLMGGGGLGGQNELTPGTGAGKNVPTTTPSDNIPPVDKEGNPIKLTDQSPPLVSGGTPPKQTAPTPPPAVSQSAPPGNNVVIRQWNLNRGIPSSHMQWDPATQSLMMDGRPVFQVGRNMSIDAQGNGVTDENTWRQEMQRYGYGEQTQSNIPDYERKLLAGADTTRDPNVYWPSAEGMAARQQISRDRDKGLIDARSMAGARGASTDSGTYARLMGNVYGTEQQALVDAAPKLMDATRRSYLDVLNSDIMARNQANAQEIAESNATGMYRGQLTYPAQKDMLQGVQDVAGQRESMPGMDTGLLTNPGLKAVGGQINDIAGQQRYPVTLNNTNAAIALEGHRDLAASRVAGSKAAAYTPEQNKLQTELIGWMKANDIPLNSDGMAKAIQRYGGAQGMDGNDALAVIHGVFSGGGSAKAAKPTRTESRDNALSLLTGYILDKIPGDGKPDTVLRDKIIADLETELNLIYGNGQNVTDPALKASLAAQKAALYPLTLVEAKDYMKKAMGIANSRYDDAMALQQKLMGNPSQPSKSPTP